MHTLVEVNAGSNPGAHVPAFLAKLWKLVDDPSTDDLICWSENGNSFIIHHQAQFSRELLPLYYKHNNMASFVRQLNMYGFHKVVSVDQGGLKLDRDEMEFAHPFFLRGHEISLEMIKRKISTHKHEERVRPENLTKIIMDVKQMKGRQESIDDKLISMKRENEALWNELGTLRQKHVKQQQIVSKLLQFLVGMVSQTNRLGYKRRMPITFGNGAKPTKISRDSLSKITGPVIHDVTELLDEQEAINCDMSPEIAEPSNQLLHLPESVSSPASSAPEDPVYKSSDMEQEPEYLISVNPASVTPVTVQKKPEQAKGKPPSPMLSKSLQEQIKEIKQEADDATASAPAASVKKPAGNGKKLNLMNIDMGSGPKMFLTSPGMLPVEVVLTVPSSAVVTSTPAAVNTAEKAMPTDTLTTTSLVSSHPSPQATDSLPEAVSSTVPPSLLQQDDPCRSKEYLNGHVDEVQTGLNNLKEFLSNDAPINVDNETLMGLFDHHEDALNSGDPNKLDADWIYNEGESQAMTSPSGPLMTNDDNYNPTIFELTEDDPSFFDESSNIILDDELNNMLTTSKDQLIKGGINEVNTPAAVSPTTASALQLGFLTPSSSLGKRKKQQN